MRKCFALAVLLLPTVAVTGCVHAPVVPPLGGLYTGIQAPLDVELDETEMGTRSGESSSLCILGLVAVGDASTHTAARNGGIKIIRSADYSYVNVLGIYQGYSTIVYGD
jgi:hypothetical protein